MNTFAAGCGFQYLRRAILKGDLKPGERLMEIALAEKLGIPMVIMEPVKGGSLSKLPQILLHA